MSNASNTALLRILAALHPTPFYLYDVAIMRSRLAELSAFDVVRYAQKACSNTAILRLLREAGAVVDAVSANEVRRALHAGYTANTIVYTADIFDADALDLVVSENIHVNCGSLAMIAQYGQRLRERAGNITLRINPGFGHGHSLKTNTGGETSKHGIWFTQGAEAVSLAAVHGLAVTGLHIHIGSGTDLTHLAQVCDFLEHFATELTGIHNTLTTISAGGGLPVPYRPSDERIDLVAYHQLWRGVQTRLSQRFGREIILEIEPGRYLVAESGCLVATICAIKQQGRNTFYLLDAGFNDLARAAMYGAYHPLDVLSRTPKPTQPEILQDVVLGGPLCESGDIFTQEEGGVVVTRRLPTAEVGDIVVIGNAGAYGAAMSSNYNSRSLAAELLVDGNETRLIRRRQTFEDIIACEC